MIPKEHIECVIDYLETATERHPPKPKDDEYMQGLKSGIKIGLNHAIDELKKVLRHG